MTLACDGLLIIIILMYIVNGVRRGFVRSFMGLIKGAVSALCAYAYTPALAAYIKDNYIMSRITDGINETLLSLSLDTTTDLYNLDKIASDLPDPLVSILERYNITQNDFINRVLGLTDITSDSVYDVSREIASPTANILSSAIAFIGIFIAVSLVLSIITWIIDLIFKFPVLSTANKFFGFVFGCGEAYLISTVLSIALFVLMTQLGSIAPSAFGADVTENTVICKFLYESAPKMFDIIKSLFA